MCPEGEDQAWPVREPVGGSLSVPMPPRARATDTVSESFRPETKFARVSRHSDPSRASQRGGVGGPPIWSTSTVVQLPHPKDRTPKTQTYWPYGHFARTAHTNLDA